MSNTAGETPEIRSDVAPAETPNPSHLENEKLKLEIRLLARQMSKRWLALEWLKSGTVLVALIGVGVTLWAGYGQVKQAEQTRISERLDKALTRLASDKPNERMTGVSSLRLFLNEEEPALRAQALNFLVDAASVETDQLVQSVILDVFSGLKKNEVSQRDLNALLKNVIDRNRSLASSIRSERSERVTKDKKQKLAAIPRFKLKADQIPDEIPLKLVSELTLEEYLDFLETERGRFERLEPKQNVPLSGVSRLITALLKVGAKATDFSRIACQWCDFSVTRDLSGVNFDHANLEHANFSRVNLQGSSFKEANLSDTIFFAADLSNANLRDNTLEVDWSDITYGLPLFDCANLKGADLTGTPLLYYKEDFIAYLEGGHFEETIAARMLSPQIDQTTNLGYFTIVVVTTVTDDYLTKNPRDPRFSQLLKREAISDDPLLQYSLTPCKYRRSRANFKLDNLNESAFSNTSCIQLVRVDSSKLPAIRSDMRGRLSGFLDQPALSAIPLLAAFTRELNVPADKKLWHEGLEYACDDINPPDASMLRIKRKDLRQSGNSAQKGS